MYNENHVIALGEVHFAATGRRHERQMDEQEAREERLAELMEEYEKQGDFYDATGSAKSAEEKLNLLWKARNRRDFHTMCRLMDEIMAEAANDYAEMKILKEGEENEERAALARAKRCGRVPAGYDD